MKEHHTGNKRPVIFVIKNLAPMMKIRNIIKLEVIVIILEDIEQQLMLCVVKNVKYQKRFQ